MNFSDNNNFTIIIGHLSKKFQKELRNNIKDFQLIIHKGLKWKYINLNPSPVLSNNLEIYIKIPHILM
jgi:hypothetical protein